MHDDDSDFLDGETAPATPAQRPNGRAIGLEDGAKVEADVAVVLQPFIVPSDLAADARPDQTLRPTALPARAGDWQQADTLLSDPRLDTERSPLAWLGDATMAAPTTVEELDAATADGASASAKPSLRRVPLHDEAEEFRILGRLGAGGMAVVELAEQRSLGREVAIKRPIDQQGASGALLTEARITGGLEHPAIVPVHELVLDSDGVPAMVMKRLEGESWRDRLEREHAAAAGAPLSDDAMTRHVEMAIALCNALDYAHSRGVVHLDVKPDNVMVGHFGEVWLLDWGIAVHLDAPSRARDDRLLGTPSYMAPEQLRGRAAVDVRTDGFLVGASLHHALMGQALHGDGSVMQVIRRAQRPQPAVYGSAIPESLAAILHRACAAEPKARYADTAGLRDALSSYLRHRDAEALAARARLDLQRLETAVAALQPGASGGSRAIETMASRARFGFEAALHAYPSFVSATEGLRRTLLASIAFELWRENAAAAAALLESVHDAPAETVTAVRTAQRLAAERGDVFRELEAIKRDAMFRSEDWRSSIGLLANGGIWAFFWLGMYAVQRSEIVAMDAKTNAILGVSLATMMLAMFWALRHLLLENRIRRGFSGAIAAYVAAGLLNRVAGLVNGQTFAEGLQTDWMALFCFLAVSAAVVDTTLWLAAGICAAGTVASAAWPARALIFAAGSTLLINGVVAWTVRPRKRAAQAETAA